MCTVLVAAGWRTGEAVVLAANRDELRSRPTDPPLRLTDDPPLFGGRDRLAGGTWLAVDPRGRLCAVTNRHHRPVPTGPGEDVPEVAPRRDPSLRSRGELPVRVLGAAHPLDELARVRPSDYNPVNVLYASADGAWWAALGAGDDRRLTPLEPGVHALTVHDVDDSLSPKTVRLLSAARDAAALAVDAADLRDRWSALLGSHVTDGDDPASAACIHGGEYGTVSSSTVLLGAGATELRYADGPPCVTPYARVELGRRD